MPWVDMLEDIRLIRAGHGERLPNDRWIVNGRMYVQESSPSGRMYPESGDGVVILTRSQYKALSIIQGYNADTATIEFRLRNEHSISDADIEFVRDLLRRATT